MFALGACTGGNGFKSTNQSVSEEASKKENPAPAPGPTPTPTPSPSPTPTPVPTPPPPVASITYYVSPGGSDAVSCASAQNITTPKRNIMGASGGISCLKAGGEKLLVRGGTYDESITNSSLYTNPSPSWPSGTSWSNAITVAAYPGETVTLTQPINLGDCCQNTPLPQLSYWIFDGFRLNANISTLIYNQSHVDHIRFSNMDVTNNFTTNASPIGDWLILGGNATGMCVAGGGAFLEFINIEIHHCGAYGVYFGGHDSLFDRIKMHDTYGYGFHIYKSGSREVTNVTVRNSEVYDIRTVLRNGGPNPGIGILLASGSGGQAYNNIVRNNGTGIGASYGSGGYKIFNNTVYGNSEVGIGVAYLDNGGATISNNILYNNAKGSIVDWTAVNPVYSNNLCDKAGFGCTSVGDPKFKNAAGNDFHLSSQSSAAIDKGMTLSEGPLDRDDIARTPGGTCDLGAYEYHE